MQILRQYLLKHLLFSCLTITGVLVGAVWITQSLRFVEIVFRKVDVQAAFVLLKLSLFVLPNLLVLLLPIGLAIGCLFALHKLLDDREIVVMWAGGISNAQISRIVAIIGAVACFFSFWLQAYISPLSMAQFKELERSVRQNISISFLETGVFQEFGDITLYVKRKRNGELFDILAYVQPQGHAPYTLIAERGSFLKDEHHPKLVLENGIRQEKKTGDAGKISTLNFNRTIVELTSAQKAPVDTFKKPSEYYLWELFNVVEPDKNMQLKLSSEIHQRFISPYLSFLFPYLVTFLLLLHGFKRRGYTKRLGQAILSVLVLQAIVLIALNSTNPYFIWGTYGLLLSLSFYIYFKLREKTA